MKKQLRITLLVDDEYYHPTDPEYLGLTKQSVHEMEFFVAQALRNNGHAVSILPYREPLPQFIAALLQSKPGLVFNLAQHHRLNRRGEAWIASVLELLQLKYTGADAAASLLALDKKMSKDVLQSNGIKVPGCSLITKNTESLPGNLSFPIILKPNFEGGSEGIMATSLAKNIVQFESIKKQLLKTYGTLIAESFIEGSEVTAGVLGNGNSIHVCQPRELFFARGVIKKGWFMTAKFKEDEGYRKKLQTGCRDMQGSRALIKVVKETVKKVYEVLQLRDYARIDLRVTANEEVYVLDVNVNPTLKPGHHSIFDPWNGMHFDVFIQKIVAAALARYK
jgi:D-alanine-D-alanine ligase